jgi:hypothetical protein
MTDALARLFALRSHLDCVILAEQAALGISPAPPVESGSCPQCQAGPDDVIIADMLGGAKLRKCKRCDAEWTA